MVINEDGKGDKHHDHPLVERDQAEVAKEILDLAVEPDERPIVEQECEHIWGWVPGTQITVCEMCGERRTGDEVNRLSKIINVQSWAIGRLKNLILHSDPEWAYAEADKIIEKVREEMNS